MTDPRVEAAVAAMREHPGASSEPGYNRWRCDGCGEVVHEGRKSRVGEAFDRHVARAALSAADRATQDGLRIEGTWLVREVNEHTCGTAKGGHYGAHEPGCGLVPVLDLSTLPGFDMLRATQDAGVSVDGNGREVTDLEAALFNAYCSLTDDTDDYEIGRVLAQAAAAQDAVDREALAAFVIGYLDTAPWFYNDSNAPDVIAGVRELADALLAAGFVRPGASEDEREYGLRAPGEDFIGVLWDDRESAEQFREEGDTLVSRRVGPWQPVGGEGE